MSIVVVVTPSPLLLLMMAAVLPPWGNYIFHWSSSSSQQQLPLLEKAVHWSYMVMPVRNSDSIKVSQYLILEVSPVPDARGATVSDSLLRIRGVWACEPEQLVQGCRIDEGACVCGLGCDTTFHYSTRDQCQTALKSQKRDPCESSPCENGGVCSQTLRDPGYQCLCANTGHYGHTCHKKCPTPEEFSNDVDPDTNFPIECMIM